MDITQTVYLKPFLQSQTFLAHGLTIFSLGTASISFAVLYPNLNHQLQKSMLIIGSLTILIGLSILIFAYFNFLKSPKIIDKSSKIQTLSEKSRNKRAGNYIKKYRYTQKKLDDYISNLRKKHTENIKNIDILLEKHIHIYHKHIKKEKS